MRCACSHLTNGPAVHWVRGRLEQALPDCQFANAQLQNTGVLVCSPEVILQQEWLCPRKADSVGGGGDAFENKGTMEEFYNVK